MIKLYLISIFCFLVSYTTPVQKETSFKSQPQYRFSIAAPDQYTNIKGFRSTFDVRNLGGGSEKSIWISLRVNGIFFQTGYFTHAGSTDFFTMQLEGTPTGFVYLNDPILKMNEKQTFTFYNILGTTKWRVALNHIDIYEENFGADYGYQPFLAIESSYSPREPSFPLINAYPAMELLVDGKWIPSTTGRATMITLGGLEGKIQNPSLRPNELNFGKVKNKQTGLLF
jgi:hypothetical protein